MIFPRFSMIIPLDPLSFYNFFFFSCVHPFSSPRVWDSLGLASRHLRAALRQSIKAFMAGSWGVGEGTRKMVIWGWFMLPLSLYMWFYVITHVVTKLFFLRFIEMSVWNELSRVIRVVDGLFTTWACFMALGLPHEPAWPSKGRIEPIPSRESWYQLLGSDWLPSFMLDPYKNTNLTL